MIDRRVCASTVAAHCKSKQQPSCSHHNLDATIRCSAQPRATRPSNTVVSLSRRACPDSGPLGCSVTCSSSSTLAPVLDPTSLHVTRPTPPALHMHTAPGPPPLRWAPQLCHALCLRRLDSAAASVMVTQPAYHKPGRGSMQSWDLSKGRTRLQQICWLSRACAPHSNKPTSHRCPQPRQVTTRLVVAPSLLPHVSLCTKNRQV